MNPHSERDKGKTKVVIIGGGLAGMTLAMELLRREKDVEITVVKKERLGSYSPCGMPFVLEGKVGKMEDILLHPPDFYTEKGIILKMETKAINLDLDGHEMHLDSGEILKFDILAIATGGKPFIPSIEGVDLEGVYTLSNYEDGVKVRKAMRDAEKAVIIGGGVIGLETAVAFAKKGIRTTVIEMLPSILPQLLDQDMASIVHKRLEGMGLELLTSTKVSSINGERTVEFVITDKKKVKADIVVIATGIRPNADLAKHAGVALGKSGGIVTNSRLNVKKEGRFLDNVFALGDCMEIKNRTTNSSQTSGLGSTAALQARIVAENISGGEVGIESYLIPAITVIGDLHVGSVGLTSHAANQAGITPEIGKAAGVTRSSYYPGRKQIHIKLLVHDKLLMSAQVISEEDVKERVNAITLAIQNRMKITDLLHTERCFTPPLSLLTDPFIRALESLSRNDV